MFSALEMIIPISLHSVCYQKDQRRIFLSNSDSLNLTMDKFIVRQNCSLIFLFSSCILLSYFLLPIEMLRSAAIRSAINCSNSSTSSLPQSFSPALSCFSSFVCFRSFSSATRPGYSLRPKVTPLELQKLRQSGEPIIMVTAYTFPSAMHVDNAGIDFFSSWISDSLLVLQ